MITVGIRQLRDHLSHYLRRVQAGERLMIAEKGKVIAVISPHAGRASYLGVEAVLWEGIADWSGGKPRGSRQPARMKGLSMTQTIIDPQ